MDPKEMGTGGMRQRSSPKEARGKEEPQILNDGEHLDSITAHIQWKRQLEVMKAEVLGQVHNQLSDLLDTALEEAAHSFPQHLMVGPAKKQSREKGQPLQKKVFVRQVPLLDTLMEVEHFRTIYHVFVAILCICAINKIIVDSVNEGRLALDFQLLIFSFGQLPMTVFAWFCMFLYTLFVPYQALQIWSGSLKTARFPNLSTVTLVVLVVLCHTAVLGFFPVYVATHCNLGAASRCIVISEQVRFLMKTYSFLRESMPPLLHARVQDGKMRPPEFSAYLYFLFCPCLLYRESYPRDPYIRWSYVIQNLAKFLACIFYMNFILEYFTIPLFNNMHKQPFHINSLVLSILHTTVPGIVLLLLGFYLFMQCWSNCFAEMLRFADRGFYKDWWNSTSFSAYYRFWNVIVHDWLYCYIYQDFLWLIGGRARAGAICLAFLVSAATHEYVISLTLGFFYPVMFVLFITFGVFFNFVLNDNRRSPVWNIIMWASICLGQGIQVCLYSQEYYAQIHCPLKEKTFWGLVTPRSWSCHL